MRHVKLILTQDVESLGYAGDLVSVKPGYARNYLVPRGKAIPATEARVRELEHHKRVIAERVARELKDLQASRDRLEQVELEISARAGEEGRLFGSVTSAQLAEALAEKGFAVERRRIVLSEPIKEVGDHKVPIRLHRDLVANVTVRVTATTE
jgi:large subunit ribosomal protein L9